MLGRTLVAITSADGHIVSLNHHCEAATGYTLAEVAGQPVWVVLAPPQFAGPMRDGVLRAAAGVFPDDERGNWKTKGGELLPVHWGYSVLRDPAGKVQSLVVTGHDQRALRRMQADLSEAIDRYQAILDTAVDGILTIGEDGLMQSFNRAAERIFGYRAMEVLGRNVSTLMPEPYRREHDTYLSSYLSTRRKKIIGVGREVEGLRKDGTVFPLELSVGEVVVSGQRVYTGIIRDITDRKTSEQEARRRQDELAHLTRVHSMGDLAAGLAHEINQPLTAILGHSKAWLRMIDAGEVSSDTMRQSFEQIGKQAERAAEVIQRLRRYVERGQVERQPNNLDVSVHEVLALLQHELKAHDVDVQLTGLTDLPQLLMDRVQIEQVLVNLVRNAVEAMAEAGVSAPALGLTAVVSDAPGGVRLSIRDNGPGFGKISPDQLFAPFFTTKKQGLGQGLSICQRIVQAHGGRIWAEPVQPRGAIFHFWLPLEQGSKKSVSGITA